MTSFIGIDWSEQKHDILFMNKHDEGICHLVIPHSATGLLQFEAMRQQLGLSPSHCLVGIETAHNLLVDHLWDHGYTQVYVIPPRVVKRSRGRYGQAGARTDKSDALLLADLLRTDRNRLQLWQPDSVLTRQMRATVSRIAYFTSQIVSLSNRLRAILLRYYPAALEVFSSHRTKIALAFIKRYPTPEDARALSFDEFAAFTQEQHYKHPRRIANCYQRLHQMQPSPDTVHVYQEEAVQLARLLQTLIQVKTDALAALTTCFHQHPDRFIFASLPGAGQLLAPALLSKFGDHRQRFPSPAQVQALAGTCPVTEQSGKRKVIRFRRACDKEFRTFAQQWARFSLKQSAWAQAYWQRARPRCASNTHALRCLANRWLAVAWKLWQDRIPYDESYHLKQSLAHRRPLH